MDLNIFTLLQTNAAGWKEAIREFCIEKQVGVLGICHVSHLYMGTLEMIKYDITCVKYILYCTV